MFGNLVPGVFCTPLHIASRSSIVFQDDAMVMLLYRRKYCYCFEKVFMSMNTWRWRTTLNPNVAIGWLLHYTLFSHRKSEQQHRTMTFAKLPNHPLLLTMAIVTLLTRQKKAFFFRCKHKKTTWASCSYKILANVNRNLGTNSYGKLFCRKYWKLWVFGMRYLKDNMCIIIHCWRDCFLTVVAVRCRNN